MYRFIYHQIQKKLMKLTFRMSSCVFAAEVVISRHHGCSVIFVMYSTCTTRRIVLSRLCPTVRHPVYTTETDTSSGHTVIFVKVSTDLTTGKNMSQSARDLHNGVNTLSVSGTWTGLEPEQWGTIGVGLCPCPGAV